MNPTSSFAPKALFIVQVSSATNKASWKWRHPRRNVAIIETDGRSSVSMISDRARGVRQIVAYWGRLYAGTSPRCQFQVAYTEAEATASRLNAEAQRACDAGGGVASCG